MYILLLLFVSCCRINKVKSYFFLLALNIKLEFVNLLEIVFYENKKYFEFLISNEPSELLKIDVIMKTIYKVLIWSKDIFFIIIRTIFFFIFYFQLSILPTLLLLL